MYRFLLKPLLFLFQPEKAHGITMALFSWACALPWGKKVAKKAFSYHHPSLELTVWGLKFSNPVGLAAGFDKDGKYLNVLPCLGFGFIEIGTITPQPQAGNDQPRLFRLPGDRGLINRMGFNNDGMVAAAERLKKYKRRGVIIGGNIGKNKNTPNSEASDDYLSCFHTLYPFVDYFVVNVSSPNTPGLRELQDKEPLTKLLTQLMGANKALAKAKPILLKIAPDLSTSQLDDIIDILKTTQIHGVIATNTTLERSMLRTETEGIGAGGLSGRPLRNKSTEIIRYLHQNSGGSFPIIGVGGIDSPETAMEKLEAGATLVQVYTGLVYEGPCLIKNITKKLAAIRSGES
jgi:dihydroorotate dehydrogenase